ncbi:UNKNOWN [Stylonychia lemnae]|uniref:Uncharacterized protein n=1 Tax=Stylonychia lemnae TaxID=5949 RepID=A0A077ZS37_STYLE|nr:UNKNOWN [Stylonychia lemnae]|eukprot:CDW72697.1 UNKNOWN [Stylonychia lemnae]
MSTLPESLNNQLEKQQSQNQTKQSVRFSKVEILDQKQPDKQRMSRQESIQSVNGNNSTSNNSRASNIPRKSSLGRKSSQKKSNVDLKFDAVREESSSDTSSMTSESEDDSTKKRSQKNSIKSANDALNDKSRRETSYNDFYQIQEEPPSKEQTISDSMSKQQDEEDSHSQNEDEENEMDFQDENNGDESTQENQNEDNKNRKQKASLRFSKLLSQQDDVAQLLEVVQKQQNDLMEYFTLKRKQSEVSMSSHQSDQIEVDGKIETIFKMLGIQSDMINQKDESGNQVTQNEQILKQNVSNDNDTGMLKRFSQGFSQTSSRQFLGFGPMLDCPSLISEQTNEDQSSSYNSKQNIDKISRQQAQSMIANQNNDIQNQLELINKEIASTTHNLKSSSHAQLPSSASQKQEQSISEVTDLEKQLTQLQLKKQQLQFEHQQRLLQYTRTSCSSIKIRDCLVNQKLLMKFQRSRRSRLKNSYLSYKTVILNPLIYLVKLKIQEKDERVESFKRRYKECKGKYSDLKNRIDEMLIKKNEEAKQKREKKDLKIENEFLQHQIYTLQNELSIEKREKLQANEYQQKIKYYEGIIEDLSYENAKLTNSKSSMKSMLIQMQLFRISKECEDYKHKYEVSEKLRVQLKEFFSKNIQKQADQELKVSNYEQIIMSQSISQDKSKLNLTESIDNNSIGLNLNQQQNDSIANERSLDYFTSKYLDKYNSKTSNISNNQNQTAKLNNQSLVSSTNYQGNAKTRNNNQMYQQNIQNESKPQQLKQTITKESNKITSPLRQAQNLYGAFQTQTRFQDNETISLRIQSKNQNIMNQSQDGQRRAGAAPRTYNYQFTNDRQDIIKVDDQRANEQIRDAASKQQSRFITDDDEDSDDISRDEQFNANVPVFSFKLS